MKRSNGIVIAGLATTLIAGNASAITLAEYTFDGGSTTATNVAGGITAGVANFDAWNSGTTTPGFDGSGIAFARANATNNVAFDPLEQDLADAIAADNYLSFTLTGVGASVDSITYTHGVLGSINGANYASYLFVGANGFIAVEGDELVDTPGEPTTLLSTAATSETVTMSTTGIAALQSFSGTVEVRIYLSDDTQGNPEIHTIDNILVQGVPEPSSLALFSLGGIGLIWRRCRG